MVVMSAGGVQPPVLQVRGPPTLSAPDPTARGEGGAPRRVRPPRRLLSGHARNSAHGKIIIELSSADVYHPKSKINLYLE